MLLICTSLVLCACATQPVAIERETETPHVISQLPDEVESFTYQGYRYFEDNSNGFTFRYINEAKHRLADVYVYPVADENKALDHDQLVLGSTRATLQAIGDAVEQGIYSNFNVVGAATQPYGIRTVARVEATYLRQNLASYTLVYQTEHDGTLVKVRLSMPDNESNRSSEEWDRFAQTMFDKVVSDLDETRMLAKEAS